jgi:Fur family transcriptional regulator, zinc uptake regulator
METYLETLKESGFKITKLRIAMLETFRNKAGFRTAEDLWSVVRKVVPRAGLQSVYRNLTNFSKIGIVEEVYLEGRKAAYTLCRGMSTHHHHAVCTRCGKAVELSVCALGGMTSELSASVNRIKEKTGFLVERHSFKLEGLCGDCQHEGH